MHSRSKRNHDEARRTVVTGIEASTLNAMSDYLTEKGFQGGFVEWYGRVLSIVKTMFEDEFLAERLVLTGGLPIAQVYADEELKRLSYDSDVVYRHMDGSRDWGDVWEEIDERMKKALYVLGYTDDDIKISPTYRLNRFTVSFMSLIGQEREVKIEIGYMNRAPLSADGDSWAQLKVAGTDKTIRVRVPPTEELYASKLAALLMRRTSRDIYDIWCLSQHPDLIKRDVFRKCVITVLLGDMDHSLFDLDIRTFKHSFADDLLRSRLPEERWKYVSSHQDDILTMVQEFVRQVFGGITDDERAVIEDFYDSTIADDTEDSQTADLHAKKTVQHLVDRLDPDNVLGTGARVYPPMVDMWLQLHSRIARKTSSSRERRPGA